MKSSLSRGRKVHVFAIYTRTRDVTRRLERILQREGIRVAVLTSDVKPELREAWYERQSRQGVQVVIGHPKLISLGLLEYADLFFWETGYSLYTLRQASRRSWRIGQTQEVTVKYFAYANTAQETCLRLMGRKLLVALAMEGKFSTEGLQAVGEDDDLLMAMARELVTEKGIGESAETIWRQIQEQNVAIGQAEWAPPELPEAEPALEREVVVSPHGPSPPVVNQLLLFGVSLDAAPSRKRAVRRSAPAVLPADKQRILF